MTVLGVLIILLSVALYVVTKFINLREEDVVSTNRFGEKITLRASPPFLLNYTGKKTLMFVGLGVFLMCISGMFFINKSGTATSIQYLWGGDKAVTTQGLKLKFWGNTIPVSFEIAMQDVILEKDEDGKFMPLPESEGIYFRKAQQREFADAIKADVAASLIVSINYSDEEGFLTMVDKNRSELKLVKARIYPVYEQALKNTCKLMDAQDYISGASSQFDYYLKDQMENGMYLTEEVYSDIEEVSIVANDTTKTVAKGKVSNGNKREKKYRIRRDSNGDPIRDSSNSLKRYGLTVQQAAVTNIDWEKSFDERLTDQKEQVAQTQLEKQEAEKEYYATQKAIAKGEREKAETRVKLEKIQLEKTISADTKAKEASYKEQEETNLLAAAKKQAQRVRVMADAESYEIKKKVQAGITPEKRLEMELNAEVAKEEARAKRAVPNTMIVGGDGKGSSSISNETLMLMQLTNKDK
tara:strand:+ start:163 stop:1569 length:1407 start_codon:yes stop_codon:yes gene_type:complete